MKKTIVFSLLGLGLALGILWASVSKVHAQNSSGSPVQTLVQRLAAKFNLKESDVQAVFDQDKADRQAQREKLFEDRLTQAVTDGKITDAQKQAIIAKHKELQTTSQKDRTDMQSWLKANGLENVDLGFGFGGFGHMGMGRGMMRGW